MAVSLSQCHKSGDKGEDLEIVFCRSSLIPHQATMDSKSGMLFPDSHHYYVLYSNYGDLGRMNRVLQLLEQVGEVDFLNSKDDYRNTVLHTSTALKQFEVNRKKK